MTQSIVVVLQLMYYVLYENVLHLDVRQYQSVEFYKAKKRLIDRYEEVSGGIKADNSPDPLPLPQEMKKQKKKYEGWFAWPLSIAIARWGILHKQKWTCNFVHHSHV
jgi:hypothetical protein